MNFKGHPFEGLTEKEVCEKIYSPNQFYEQDIKEIEELIGGKENYVACHWSPVPGVFKGNGNTYRITVLDPEKTLFKQKGFKNRAVGYNAFLYLEGPFIMISANGLIDQELKKLSHQTLEKENKN